MYLSLVGYEHAFCSETLLPYHTFRALEAIKSNDWRDDKVL